jgi:hypothetical protein
MVGAEGSRRKWMAVSGSVVIWAASVNRKNSEMGLVIFSDRFGVSQRLKKRMAPSRSGSA